MDKPITPTGQKLLRRITKRNERMYRPRKSLFSFAKKRIFDSLLSGSQNVNIEQTEEKDIVSFLDQDNHITITISKDFYGSSSRTEAVKLEYSNWHTPGSETDIYTDRGQINRRLKSVFEMAGISFSED